jgi:hypothetical protein
VWLDESPNLESPTYGEVVTLLTSGSYYIEEARLGQLKYVDPENLAFHGATIRPVVPKEKYPFRKAYVSPKEKREKLLKKQGKRR